MTETLSGRDMKASWDWLAFAAALPAKPIQFRNLAASQQIFTGRCIVTGISINNSATTGGLVTLHDGQDTTGEIIQVQGYGASATQQGIIPCNGVLTEIGVYLELAGGVVSGCVYVIPLWFYNVTPPGE